MIYSMLFIAFAAAALAWLFWPKCDSSPIARSKKKDVEIFRIVRVTPGGLHAWCESNVGLIKKPTNSPALAHLIN